MEKVILSSTILPVDGTYTVTTVSQETARAWVDLGYSANYCTHETTKILGVKPAPTRENCTGYDEALCLAAQQRLEFGKEYTKNELQKIGVNFRLIARVDR